MGHIIEKVLVELEK